MAGSTSTASQVGPSRSAKRAAGASGSAAWIAREVQIMQPSITSSPSAFAAAASASASVSPPALSSLILTIS